MQKLIYIAGHSRSGSTLLDRLLGAVDGSVSVGELSNVWRRGFIDNQLCSCGEPFNSCQHWSAIVRQLGDVDVEEILTAQSDVDRLKNLPRILSPSLQSARFKEQLQRYLAVLGRFYSAIQHESGANFVVDSSKKVSYAHILNQMPETQVMVIHLVRDARAVAYSRQRRKERPEIHWKKATMAYTKPSKTAWQWLATNIALDTSSRRFYRYLLVRYEDLVRDPRCVLENINQAFDERTWDLSFLTDDTAQLSRNHSVSGNPMRFDSGLIKIKPDEEWRAKLATRDRRLLSALTWPWLKKYSYMTNAAQ